MPCACICNNTGIGKNSEQLFVVGQNFRRTGFLSDYNFVRKLEVLGLKMFGTCVLVIFRKRKIPISFFSVEQIYGRFSNSTGLFEKCQRLSWTLALYWNVFVLYNEYCGSFAKKSSIFHFFKSSNTTISRPDSFKSALKSKPPKTPSNLHGTPYEHPMIP